MRRPFWIDTDTASDDAVALMMAFAEPSIEIVGIGIVSGNVPLDQAIQNALFVRELCGRGDVPVFAGADRPLKVPLHTAQNVHGHDGMGDIGLDLVGRSPNEGDAVDELLAASRRHRGELTLVTLGPLTNIAQAVRIDPTLPQRVSRLVAMGAVADHIGNVTPVAEFNMWADPDAVQIVLDAGFPLEFVGWDISRKYAVITPEQAETLRAIANPVAEVAIDIQGVVAQFCATETGLAGFDLPDPIAMAIAIDPDVATETRAYYCATEVGSSLTRGMVVMDVLELLHHPPNAQVVVAADQDRFLAKLESALAANPRA